MKCEFMDMTQKSRWSYYIHWRYSISLPEVKMELLHGRYSTTSPQVKMELLQWRYSTSPKPKKAQPVCNNAKRFLAVFFDETGAQVQVSQVQNITKEYNLGISIAFLTLSNISTCEQLHHDNAPSHVS